MRIGSYLSLFTPVSKEIEEKDLLMIAGEEDR